MTTETAEILERLHACEAGLEVHRGYLKAMEYALRVSFITHQDPDALLSTWTKLLPAIANSHRSEGGSLFAAAFEQSLTILTEQMGTGHPASTGSDDTGEMSI